MPKRCIVLNSQNIGHAYGSTTGAKKRVFKWEGVRKAVQYYKKQKPVPDIKIITPDTPFYISKCPDDIKKFLVKTPSRKNAAGKQKDIDDLYTLKFANKYNCQFVDNDCYKDWPARLSEGQYKDEALAKWFKQNAEQLHVSYAFDNAEFMPDRPLPTDDVVVKENKRGRKRRASDLSDSNEEEKGHKNKKSKKQVQPKENQNKKQNSKAQKGKANAKAQKVQKHDAKKKPSKSLTEQLKEKFNKKEQESIKQNSNRLIMMLSNAKCDVKKVGKAIKDIPKKLLAPVMLFRDKHDCSALEYSGQAPPKVYNEVMKSLDYGDALFKKF